MSVLLWLLPALVVLPVLLIAAFFVARQRGVFVQIEKLSLNRLARKIRPHTRIWVPEGDGPFPIVILMHGCGGPRGVQAAYARHATACGFMALAPDSLALRDISYEEAVAKVCTGARLRAGERAGDLFAALEIARHDPRADAQTILLAGWSHGAWTIMDAMTYAHENLAPPSLKHLPIAALNGVRGVLALYPYSGFLARSRGHDWPSDIKVEALLVRGDAVCSDVESAKLFEGKKASGQLVNWSYIDGATHGFDEQNHKPNSGLVYDAEKAKEAEAVFVEFLNSFAV